jgi:adenosylmethionine-8-amino-7-oxononanoate aminotransferase
MITSAQKTLLHVAKAKLGLSREDYEAILVEQAGVSSSTELDNKGFDQVVKRFEELGFHNTARRPRKRQPGETVTAEQLAKIQALFLELGIDTRARQAGFCKRQCRKPWVQTREDANKVIEALKKMIDRGYDAERNNGPNAE